MRPVSPSTGTSRARWAGSLAMLVIAAALAALVLATSAAASTGWVHPGSGWAERNAPQPFEDFRDVALGDAVHTWVVGADRFSGASVGVVIATSNGGATWRQEDVGPASSFDGVASVDSSHCWVVGGMLVDGAQSGVIYATSDGGATWAPQLSGLPVTLTALAFSDAAHGLAVGGSGTVLSTVNGGADWATHLLGSDEDLVDVAFPDPLHGWAVSATPAADGAVNGAIFATSDGGLTWRPAVSGVPAGFTGVAFADAAHGWAVTRLGRLYLTEDGGASWTVGQIPGSGITVEDIAFPDATHGWAVGGTDSPATGPETFVWVTSDGGKTWRPQAQRYIQEVDHAIAFADSRHGCSVGPNSHLMTTANGGGPLLFLRLRGLTRRTIHLGDRVTALGVVHQPLPADGKVRLPVWRETRRGGWTVAATHVGTLSDVGSYRWRYRPTRKGDYRVKAYIHSRPDLSAATVWHDFSVR
jgi:photosystem II stability/assembly factor-like uncharacterized protein